MRQRGILHSYRKIVEVFLWLKVTVIDIEVGDLLLVSEEIFCD